MQRQMSQITMDVDESNEENSKKITDNITTIREEEPLLGSITTNAVAKEEKGMQIRTSARVFKKMKLEQEQDKKHEDSNHPEVSLTSPNSDHTMLLVGTIEKNSEHEVKGPPVPVRCSTKVVKVIKQTTTNTSETKSNKSDIKKEVRKWSYGDKLLFFEAVNEFGKDFENIRKYINSRLKKRGPSEELIRSRDHVRRFFLKTFHEVSKHVKFSDSVKKVVQELYGVINYGELYRKLGIITEKALMKLYELIYRGETCIRVKGKNNRIKTPMCRALVKLNQLDEKYEEIKLPNRVTVELRPKDMTSFIKVQCIAQNPRLRTTLPIQKRLNSLIQCLTKRWKTIAALNYDKSVVSNNPITNYCVPSKQDIDAKMQLLLPQLRLSPPSESKIELPSINISEYLTRQTICLTAYESRFGLDTYSEIKEMLAKKRKPKLEVEPKMEVEQKVEVCDIIKAEEIKIEDHEVNNYYEAEPDSLLANAVHDAVNTILSLQSLDRQLSETSETEEGIPNLCSNVENLHQENQLENDPLDVQEELEHIENIRKGWTEATSESLTIGEIYLMYGSDAKFILEYSWEGDVNEEPEKPKKTAANFLEMWNDSFEESWENKQRNLTSSLSKLLSLSRIHYGQNNFKCPCGHVCNDKANKNPMPVTSSKARSNIGLLPIKQEETTLSSGLPNVPIENSRTSGGLFRPPINILPNGPAIQTPTMQQQLNSIQRLKPKFSNRKGRRSRQKQIVVERKLPLLPNNLSGHQIVRMNIISQESQVIPVEAKTVAIDVTTSSTGSNAPQQEIDLQKVIGDPDEENSSISTVPSSPSRILKEGDSEWINSEVADYSLSSLLGHLESPVKTSMALNSNMASDLSSEVDSQLQSLMSESSMDFAASFADLAASVVSDRKF